tara:strand:- start:7356 stop:8009 length:654 start_codon:yes stop_codon:yes gene_type:complete
LNKSVRPRLLANEKDVEAPSEIAVAVSKKSGCVLGDKYQLFAPMATRVAQGSTDTPCILTPSKSVCDAIATECLKASRVLSSNSDRLMLISMSKVATTPCTDVSRSISEISTTGGETASNPLSARVFPKDVETARSCTDCAVASSKTFTVYIISTPPLPSSITSVTSMSAAATPAASARDATKDSSALLSKESMCMGSDTAPWTSTGSAGGVTLTST